MMNWFQKVIAMSRSSNDERGAGTWEYITAVSAIAFSLLSVVPLFKVHVSIPFYDATAALYIARGGGTVGSVGEYEAVIGCLNNYPSDPMNCLGIEFEEGRDPISGNGG